MFSIKLWRKDGDWSEKALTKNQKSLEIPIVNPEGVMRRLRSSRNSARN